MPPAGGQWVSSGAAYWRVCARELQKFSFFRYDGRPLAKEKQEQGGGSPHHGATHPGASHGSRTRGFLRAHWVERRRCAAHLALQCRRRSSRRAGALGAGRGGETRVKRASIVVGV
jgi:hypothetical protein